MDENFKFSYLQEPFFNDLTKKVSFSEEQSYSAQISIFISKQNGKSSQFNLGAGENPGIAK